MQTYYIYHIPSVKIGVSTEPDKRVKKQGYSEYEILETHTDIMKVSVREKDLQKEYGYKVDRAPYYQSRAKWGSVPGKIGGKIGGKMGGKIGGKGRGIMGGKIGGKVPSYKLRKITYKEAEYIRIQYARKKDIFGKKITQRRLAKMFNLAPRAITLIIKNKTYIVA